MIQPKIEGAELPFRKTLIHNSKGLIFFPVSYPAILIPKISRIVSDVQYYKYSCIPLLTCEPFRNSLVTSHLATPLPVAGAAGEQFVTVHWQQLWE